MPPESGTGSSVGDDRASYVVPLPGVVESTKLIESMLSYELMFPVDELPKKGVFAV